MPEGARPYPRWDGALSTGSRVLTVAGEEARNAYRNFWARLAITFVLAYTLVFLGNLFTAKTNATTVHTYETFVDFLKDLRWGALALAAILGGPSLLEDARRGALELYLSRAVTRLDYLGGKILAIFGLCAATMLVPALLYVGATYLFFDKHPAHWGLALPRALLYVLLWATLVSGLGLGLSCVAKNSRAATLILLGGFAALDIIIRRLLSSITRQELLQLLSPFTALDQQTQWLFDVAPKAHIPYGWGLLELAALIVLGWALVAWRHPRVRGDARAGA